MEQEPKLIGVCLSTLFEEDRYNFVKKLNKYAIDGGYRLIVFNAVTDLYEQCNKNNEGASSVFSLIPYKKLSAMIIFPNFLHNEEIVAGVVGKCCKRGIPVISVDKEIEGCMCLSFNYSDAFETLCRHVIEVHGAKNVYLITGTEGNNYAEERRAAYRRALEANGIAYDEDKVGYGNFWEGPTNDILMQWFDIEKRKVPDAIICANDTMAIAVSSFLQKRGYSIPEDCIVTGFDGIEQSKIHIPPLTTCIPDYDDMGRQVIKKINSVLAGDKSTKGARVGFNIMYSRSCGCSNTASPDFNMSIQMLINHIKKSDERQTMMCSMQSAISKMADINELAPAMINKFNFHTALFAVNNDVFYSPNFGCDRKGDNSFSKKVDILHQRYYWFDIAPCTIELNELIPHSELMLKRKEPIVVCAVNFMDIVMGYCVFQPEIDIDEYQKIHAFVSAAGAALGNFHGKVQIGAINEQLMLANDELNLLSRRDFMTGLFNRRGFFDKLNEMLLSEYPGNATIVVISADLDSLKYINDTFGHAEGDEAICTVSRALVSSSVQGEVCARFGGDEFCVAAIVAEVDASYYFNDFKERFCDYLYDYNRKSGKQYIVNASIGCCVEKICGRVDIEGMIRVADGNMYVDKMEHRKIN